MSAITAATLLKVSRHRLLVLSSLLLGLSSFLDLTCRAQTQRLVDHEDCSVIESYWISIMYSILQAYVLQEQGNLLELVDQSLGSNYSKEEALQMLELSLVCTNPSPTLRPAMSSVVSMLEGKMPVKVMLANRAASTVDNVRFKALEKISHDNQTQSSVNESFIDSSILASRSKNSQAKTSYPLLHYTD
ncbi:hypothetical protein ZIOFF_057218 [Zingiber officinale]|uniref:Uncharacterized protein n=1 Tax=Zingiber officinale TaxID=94328 RepID=A0A8J5KKT4_ZINOF|nr:hypothetical protein ZIOFF_057218 [Zingiber officinale]